MNKKMKIEDRIINRKRSIDLGTYIDAERRLNDVRDIFNSRQGDDGIGNESISLAEGGCLMRPHHTVLQALMESVHDYQSSPFQIYPQSTVDMDLIARASDFFARECCIPTVASDNICLGIGSSHIFDMYLGAVCGQDDIILSPESYYHAFAEWPSKWGGHLVCVSTDVKNGYKLTAHDLRSWLQSNPGMIDKVKTILLCNPTTTGAVYSYEEMKSLSDVVQEYDLLVLSDEVFRGSEFEGQETVSIASIPGMAERTVTTHSGSKTRGVADFRIGWGCGPKPLIDKMIALTEQSITEIPLYLQKVGLAALNTPVEYLKTAAQEYKTRVDMLAVCIDDINSRLSQHFGVYDDVLIHVPFVPQSGHYMMISMNSLRGWETADGQIIQSGADLTRYFAQQIVRNEDGGFNNGSVVFSAGYSKGHDDMTLYIAFAQSGYKEMSQAMANLERRKVFEAYLRQNSTKNLTQDEINTAAKILGLEYMQDNKNVDYVEAAQSGRSILLEAMNRMEAAIMKLQPVAVRICKDHELYKCAA